MKCDSLFPRGRVFLLLMLAGGLLFAGPARSREIPPDADWFIDMNRFAGSAHGTMTCEACHGTMKEGGKLHPEARDPRFLQREASRTFDFGRCRSCHRTAHERTLSGAHGEALRKEKAGAAASRPPNAGPSPAPTCGNCHSSHYVKAHRSRLELGREMTATCGACHPAQAETYLENPHGKKAVHLGKISSAYCTDCHGAHDCRSLKDRKTALEACRRCHPQAGESFAGFVIHASTRDLTAKDQDKKFRVGVIRTVTLVMLVLVVGLVALFYGHSFLWVLRELHEKLKRRKP